MLLPERQYRIIAEVVKSKGRVNVEVLAEKLGLKTSDIMRDLAELQSKNLIIIEKKSAQKAHLTEEAHRYIDRGFPEERLLRILIYRLYAKMLKISA